MNDHPFDKDTEMAIRGFLKRRGIERGSENYHSSLICARSWLNQFEVDEQPYMTELLKAIRIETPEKISRSIEKVAQSLRKKLSNKLYDSVFFGLGESPASSGSYFLYPLLQSLSLDPSYAKSEDHLKDALRENKIVVFIDDIVGSGNQAVAFSKKYLPPGCEAFYCALYGMESGIENIKKNGSFKSIVVSNLLRKKDQLFSPDSSILTDQGIRKKVKSIVQKYGRELYRKHPLGYENSQLLIAFPHNVPNNTIPIIWAGPSSESGVDYWEPLVPRIKAPKPFVNEAKKNFVLKTFEGIEKPEGYENVQPFDPSKILDVFVEPEYDYEILSADNNLFPLKTDFLTDAKNCITEKNRF